MYKEIPKLEKFEQAHQEGRVTRSDYDDYVIFKYGRDIQFAKDWDDVTIRARGIIFDERTKECVVLPFKKFFNLGETGCDLSAMSDDPNYEILEKMDGSMGCIFLNRDKELHVATPGSLMSDQAKWATKWLRAYVNYEAIKAKFINGEIKALIAEIICPLSRIVVPYDFEGLVLTAAQGVDGENVSYLDHKSLSALGVELALPVCRKFTFSELSDIKDHLDVVEDFEGYVLHWPSTGFRIKMKADDYCRRHRILSAIHPNRIDEAIKAAENDLFDIDDKVNEVIVEFPEEFVEPYKTAIENWSGDMFDRWGVILTILARFEGEEPKALAMYLKDENQTNKWLSDTYFGFIMSAFRGKVNHNKFALRVWSFHRKEHFSNIEEEDEV